MDTYNTNSTESKETGIGRFFAGKTFPQILFGSAIWACILGYALFCIFSQKRGKYITKRKKIWGNC